MASSSGRLFAYISSEASMRLTLPNICFSPVDRPFSASRRARLRTTSASSSGSPVPIFSRLCLTRRFQLTGILVGSSRSTPTTSSTITSGMTGRMPALSLPSTGSLMFMSLCRIWML